MQNNNENSVFKMSLSCDSISNFCHSGVTFNKNVTSGEYQALPDSTRKVGTHFPYALPS